MSKDVSGLKHMVLVARGFLLVVFAGFLLVVFAFKQCYKYGSNISL